MTACRLLHQWPTASAVFLKVLAKDQAQRLPAIFRQGTHPKTKTPTSLCGESPACNFEANLVSTKIFELHEQQKMPAQKVSANHEESVNPETNKQDRSLSKETSLADNEPTMSKEITMQDTTSSQNIARKNAAKSEDNGCNAESETTERKCDNSVKEKDEPSSGQCGRAQNTPSSNSVSLNF